MLYGDEYAKQFGPSDWFKLTITGEDASNNVVGSVNFYLAQNGSIVNTWQLVDLSSLSAARTLEFDLSSTDNGPIYGMNTPAYFAMDDLKLSSVPEPSTLALLCGAGIAWESAATDGDVLLRMNSTAVGTVLEWHGPYNTPRRSGYWSRGL